MSLDCYRNLKQSCCLSNGWRSGFRSQLLTQCHDGWIREYHRVRCGPSGIAV